MIQIYTMVNMDLKTEKKREKKYLYNKGEERIWKEDP